MVEIPWIHTLGELERSEIFCANPLLVLNNPSWESGFSSKKEYMKDSNNSTTAEILPRMFIYFVKGRYAAVCLFRIVTLDDMTCCALVTVLDVYLLRPWIERGQQGCIRIVSCLFTGE